jgi:hypothetical protein
MRKFHFHMPYRLVQIRITLYDQTWQASSGNQMSKGLYMQLANNGN